jgi:NAD(P)-dependent dehydrogenase (short-subunit alcohol dehydrogenase family)
MTDIDVPALSVPTVTLVTGASGGIGRATAARLAALGSSVVVGYNSRREKAEETVRGLQGTGHVAMRVAIDEPESIALQPLPWIASLDVSMPWSIAVGRPRGFRPSISTP